MEENAVENNKTDSVEKSVPLQASEAHANNQRKAPALRAPYRSRKRKQIVGRGYGSGRGGTSTRGDKGHRSRSGFKALPFFEGGQMPLARRLPKFGFSNSPFKKQFKVVSLKDIELRLETGVEITRALLKQKRLFKGKSLLVKLTNKHKLTTLSKQFTINLKEVHVTLAARKVLEASGSQLKEGK